MSNIENMKKKVTKIKTKKSKMHLTCGSEKRNNDNMGCYLSKNYICLSLKHVKFRYLQTPESQ